MLTNTRDQQSTKRNSKENLKNALKALLTELEDAE